MGMSSGKRSRSDLAGDALPVRSHSFPLASLCLVAGAAPFAIGRLVGVGASGAEISRSSPALLWHWRCPLKALFGVPCAMCGSTRAFALATRGDRRFLRFNAWWVVVAALSMVAGSVLRYRPALETAILDEAERHPERVRALVGVFIGIGWANAIFRRL
jgi:uncharacterized membrane protein YedE/YeeE